MSDTLKWLVIACLLIVGVVGNYWYQESSLLVRFVALLLLAIGLLWVAATTSLGKKAVTFVKGAHTELQKIVWPTRQETVQSTLIVISMVAIMGLVLWGFDAMLLRTVAWLTGYGVA